MAVLLVLPVLNVHLFPWLLPSVDSGPRDTWWLNLGLVLVLNAGLLFLVAAALRKMSLGWSFIGLARPSALQLAGISALVLGALEVAIVAPDIAHPSTLVLGPHTPNELRAFLFVQLSVAGLQEVFFRGYPIQLLRQVQPVWIGVALSSFAFGYYHGGFADPASVVWSSVGGLILAVLFLLTKTLWWPLIVHVGWDLVAAGFGLGP